MYVRFSNMTTSCTSEVYVNKWDAFLYNIHCMFLVLHDSSRIKHYYLLGFYKSVPYYSWARFVLSCLIETDIIKCLKALWLTFIHNRIRMGLLWNSKLWKQDMQEKKKLCLYFSSIACGESLIGKASYSALPVFVLHFPLKGNSCRFMGRNFQKQAPIS